MDIWTSALIREYSVQNTQKIQLRADDSATSPKRLIIPVIGSVVKCFSDGVVGWLFGPLRIHHRMIKHLPNLEGVELRRSWGSLGSLGSHFGRCWLEVGLSWLMLVICCALQAARSRDQECQDEPRWRPRGYQIDLRWHPGILGSKLGAFTAILVSFLMPFSLLAAASQNNFKNILICS